MCFGDMSAPRGQQSRYGGQDSSISVYRVARVVGKIIAINPDVHSGTGRQCLEVEQYNSFAVWPEMETRALCLTAKLS